MASSKLWPYQGMNATSTLLPRASSPASVAAPSAMTWPGRDPLALLDQRALVDGGVLVGAPELLDPVAVDPARAAPSGTVAIGRLDAGIDDDLVGGHPGDRAGAARR